VADKPQEAVQQFKDEGLAELQLELVDECDGLSDPWSYLQLM
jgi:hypothetical protein